MTETSNNKIKEVDLLNLKMKEVETQSREIKTTDTLAPASKLTINKSSQTNKLEKKELELSTDKVSGGFSFENEINRIKMLILLVELANNLAYRK